MNIYICEDNRKQRETIENIILSLTENTDFNISFSTDDPKALLKKLENNKQTNIYFLDVDLNSYINGLELAKEIRKFDINGYIIFLTSHAELTLLTFQYKVRAMDYILKGKISVVKEKIKEYLTEICDDLSAINKAEKKTNQINSGDNHKEHLIIYMENDEQYYVASRYLKGLLEKCMT